MKLNAGDWIEYENGACHRIARVVGGYVYFGSPNRYGRYPMRIAMSVAITCRERWLAHH